MIETTEEDNINDFELSNSEQACLLLIKSGMKNIPSEIFNEEIKSRLLSLKLAQLDDNPEVGWSITQHGDRAIQTKIAIKYPMHVKGKLGDYNKIINTMTEGAKNALACSQINNFFFDDLPVETLRTMMQSFIDKGIYRKFGKEIAEKLKECLNEITQQVKVEHHSTNIH